MSALVKQPNVLKIPLETLNTSTKQILGLYLQHPASCFLCKKVSECVEKFQDAHFVEDRCTCV